MGTSRLISDTAAGSGSPVMRKPGDARAGVFDWLVGSGLPGYLFHLRTTDDSVASEFIFGLGIDAGAGGGMLFSIKGAGTAQQFEQAPGAGTAQLVSAYSSGSWQVVNLYGGSGGSFTRLRAGLSRLDGVATAGSTTFTSASSAFTSGDVGATLTLIPSVQANFGVSFQRTIASVTNPTTVTLNAPADVTGAGVRFYISGRTPSASQIVNRVYDTDGTSQLYGTYRGYAVSQPFQARDTASAGLVAQGISGQTGDVFRAQTDTATDVFSVKPAGNTLVQAGAEINNSNRTGSGASALLVKSSNTLSRALVVQGNNVTDTLQVQNSGGSTQVRVAKSGHLVTKVYAAPADGDVSTNEMALWLDNTPGATKLMVKAKDSTGTVRTGSVALS